MAKSKDRSDRSDDKYRWFGMILYPDNPDHMVALEYIKTSPILFPSYLYIRHLPEDWLEQMDPDLKVDGVDLSAEDLLSRGEKKPHYHVCIKTARAVSENAIMAAFSVTGDDGKKKCLVSMIPHLFNPEAYFQYLLHWDLDSIRKGKHKYSLSEIHGDDKIIGKLGAQNLYFVQNGLDLINKWILKHPGAALLEFQMWQNSLHNKDPASYYAVRQALHEDKYMISSTIKDWKFNKRDYLECPEAYFDGELIEITPDEAFLLFNKDGKRIK